MLRRDPFPPAPVSFLFSLPCWAYMPPPGTSRPEKRMRGVENILHFVTPLQSPGWDNFRKWKKGGGGGRDGEQESEPGVIRTAIMIDSVPVRTRTPLPFTFMLWVQIHVGYKGRVSPPPVYWSNLVSVEGSEFGASDVLLMFQPASQPRW